jgi:GDP-L-fucose synthase
LDVSKLKNLGWEYKIELEDGLKSTYQDFLDVVLKREEEQQKK